MMGITKKYNLYFSYCYLCYEIWIQLGKWTEKSTR